MFSTICRSICTTVMTIGFLLIMFAVEVNWLIYPAVVCLASGSFTLLVTNQPLSQQEFINKVFRIKIIIKETF